MAKVSIVIPFYNCSYVDRAIDSALNQTYKDIEVIVVNDGSTAHIDKVIPFFRKIKYVEKENGGTASALNTGIAHVTGSYFSWLSSDDVYDPNKIERQLDFMRNYEAKACYTPFYLINSNDKITSPPIATSFSTRSQFVKRMMKGNFINGCTVMLATEVLDDIGTFNESLLYTHDYDLWARICLKYPFYYLNEPLLNYRVHDGMGSKKFAREQKREIRLVRYMHQVKLRQLYKSLNN